MNTSNAESTSKRTLLAPLLLCLSFCACDPGGGFPFAPGPSDQEAFAGTWSGTMMGDDGGVDAEVRFSAAGNFILVQAINGGELREIELTHVDQSGRVVPPGGGVLAYYVSELTRNPERLTIGLRKTFEKTGAGNLEQVLTTERYDFTITPPHLQLAFERQITSYYGNQVGSTGGVGPRTHSEGTLAKRSQ